MHPQGCSCMHAYTIHVCIHVCNVSFICMSACVCMCIAYNCVCKCTHDWYITYTCPLPPPHTHHGSCDLQLQRCQVEEEGGMASRRNPPEKNCPQNSNPYQNGRRTCSDRACQIIDFIIINVFIHISNFNCELYKF